MTVPEVRFHNSANIGQIFGARGSGKEVRVPYMVVSQGGQHEVHFGEFNEHHRDMLPKLQANAVTPHHMGFIEWIPGTPFVSHVNESQHFGSKYPPVPDNVMEAIETELRTHIPPTANIRKIFRS